VAEEVLVYPQVEKKVSAEEAEHAREEHAEAEEMLQTLEKLDADDPAFDAELATLMPEIRHHIGDEEGQSLRTCAKSSTPTSCERSAPASRPSRRSPRPGHTRNVPSQPLPQMAAGPAGSLLDRMRDLATGCGSND
jgi:hypothetical protein